VSNRTEPSEPQSRPIRLPRAARREQLLDVTKEIVGEAGLHRVSIDRVAREAGISRPIVYEHFSDLTGLLTALLEREGSRALAQLSEVLPRAIGDPTEPGADVLDMLISALTGYLDAVRSDPVTWSLVLMPPEGVPDFLREGTDAARAAIVAQLAALIERAYAPHGGQRSPDPELTASSMSAVAEHWAKLLLTDPERFDRERLLVHARWAIGRFAP
jgi:AcrR family transcriptional regulator